ncbi:LON peptidase substrate-binding domain-containing protein [Opitutus sp. ER46]|uniref:LON peptidase substrate-binding domain-containing protein n=1 Tax=Opitutus sp. ER46 TaxID=2161864 RepID=UPI00130496A0|nr:LON peptidase substrate-binding domain-containing protein [Opitutus sp. ER46]
MEILIPEEVPVMTLPDTAFFPQALMPLHIFEPRYRAMLRDVLASHRLFAVAGLDPTKVGQPGAFEPPYQIASLGIVRACQKNDDGTSNLLLQGLCRVRILEIVSDTPYRRIRIEAQSSDPGASPEANEGLRGEVARLLSVKCRLSEADSRQLVKFIRSIQDPEAFVDIAAFNLCSDQALKQRLLETLDVHDRLRLFGARLRTEIEQLRLAHKLQGKLPDNRVADN